MATDRITYSRILSHVTNLGVAILGLLVVHEIAYQIAGLLQTGHHLDAPDHGHQSLLIMIAGPVALIAAITVVIRQARRLGLTVTASLPHLSATIAGLYLIQESAEVAASGTGLQGLVFNKAVPIGLLIAPMIAAVLRSFMAEAAELVRTWLGLSPPASPPTRLWFRTVADCWADATPIRLGQPRGPPFVCM